MAFSIRLEVTTLTKYIRRVKLILIVQILYNRSLYPYHLVWTNSWIHIGSHFNWQIYFVSGILQL